MKDEAIMLLGEQSSTGVVHLAFANGLPRCGKLHATTRYRLALFSGGAGEVSCLKCRARYQLGQRLIT
jgi:hypothetical protein